MQFFALQKTIFEGCTVWVCFPDKVRQSKGYPMKTGHENQGRGITLYGRKVDDSRLIDVLLSNFFARKVHDGVESIIRKAKKVTWPITHENRWKRANHKSQMLHSLCKKNVRTVPNWRVCMARQIFCVTPMTLWRHVIGWCQCKLKSSSKTRLMAKNKATWQNVPLTKPSSTVHKRNKKEYIYLYNGSK